MIQPKLLLHLPASVKSTALLFVILLNCVVDASESGSQDYRLWCYTGLKYHVGQEVRQDNMECKSMFGMKKYCYKFVGKAAMQEVVKIGCATVICSGIRNHCAEMELQGVKGTLCCCNGSSYCNHSSPARHPSAMVLGLLALIAVLGPY